MKWILGGAGIILLGSGAARAVWTGDQSGVVILIVTGSVLFLSPFVIDRLESVAAGTSNVEIHFTQKVADLGAPKVAAVLGHTALADFAQSYAFVHTELPYDRFAETRIYLQDLLVERSAAFAETNKLDAREVRKLLADGPAVIRVLAIGMMLGDSSLADGSSIAAAINDSLSGNEQYHALRLAQLCWSRLSKQDRQAVREAIRTAETSGGIPVGSDRHQLADMVLALPTGSG